MLPSSPLLPSATYKRHAPFGLSPLNARSVAVSGLGDTPGSVGLKGPLTIWSSNGRKLAA